MSGTETIIGSLVRSSHALEYSVSKFGRTTTLTFAGGNAGKFANVFIGPWPGSLAGLDVRELLPGQVHRDERIEVEVGIDRDGVRILLGDRLCLRGEWKDWKKQKAEYQSNRASTHVVVPYIAPTSPE